jgi:hypothetical protein
LVGARVEIGQGRPKLRCPPSGNFFMRLWKSDFCLRLP